MSKPAIYVLGRNIRYMVFNRLVAFLVSFFLFPFVVKHTGQEIYGIYLTVMTITGYFGLMDLGVMSALTKYVSEYNGRRDRKMMNDIINASFSFYVLIGIISSLLLFLLSKYFFLLFRIDRENIETARQLFMVAGFSSIFTWPLNTFRGAIEGLNLWDVEAIVQIIIQVMNGITAYFVFSLGYGVVCFFIILQMQNILGSIAFYVVLRTKTDISISFPYLNADTFRLILNFSIFMFLSTLINIFLFQIHNIIIGYFISMSAVTIYAVANSIQNYFRTINSTLGAPPWIYASEMEGRGDYEGQRVLLYKGTKFMSAIFVPIVLIMLFFAKPFITCWMGPGFEGSILPARIVIVFWLFNGTLELAGGMLSAKGIVKKPLYIQTTAAILNIIITLSLIKYIGINAVALGLAISMIFVGFPLSLKLSLKNLSITFKTYFNNAIKTNLALYFFCVVISSVTIMFFYPKNIYTTFLEMGIIYTGLLVLYYFKFLNQNERLEIKRLMGFEF